MAFAHPEYLVDTAWLTAHLNDPGVVVLDATTHLIPSAGAGYTAQPGRADFEQGHLPGAQFVDLQADLSEPGHQFRFMLPSAERFAASMARLGVGDATRVILYSTANVWWASRVWWLLRVFGPLAAFSMYPLLRFERLGGAAYAAALCVGIAVVAAPRAAALHGVFGGAKGRGRALAAAWAAAAAAGAAALHASYALPAPEALPYLHALAVSAFSAANFTLVALYANVRQWQLPADGAAPRRRKAA